MTDQADQWWDEVAHRFPSGQVPVAVTVSPLGMRAVHSSAAVQTPNGDYTAIAGTTIKLGLGEPVKDGSIYVRPGYEGQVAKQLQAHAERLAVRPIELQFAGETERPDEPPEQNLTPIE